MRTACFLFALMCFVAVASVGHAAIYKWVDEKGTTTYRDTPPPKGIGATVINPKPLAAVEYDSGRTIAEEIEQSLSDGVYKASQFLKNAQRALASNNSSKAFPKVELYVTSWCGYCTKAKAFFRSNRVPFKVYDVELNSRASKRHQSLNPSGSVPVAVIGGQMIRGFSPGAYSQALGL